MLVKVPLIKPQMPEKEKIWNYLKLAYEQRHFTNHGPCTALLEERLQKYLELPHAPVLVSNGTVSMEILLRAMDIKGDVLIPNFTFSATACAVLNAGCTPVLIDNELDSFDLDLEHAAKKISKVTKAMIVVLSFGFALDYKKYEVFCEKYDLKLIFDSAGALGARYFDGKKVGNAGGAESFSLHATKPFGIGEGGLITSRDKILLDKVRSLISFGFDSTKCSVQVGTNAKLSDFVSAVGLAVLDELDSKFENRKKLSEKYNEYLKNKSIKINSTPWPHQSFQMYYVLATNFAEAAAIRLRFESNGIQHRRYYVPIAEQSGLAKLSRFERGELKNSSALFEKIVVIPFFDEMTEEQIKYVCDYI